MCREVSQSENKYKNAEKGKKKMKGNSMNSRVFLYVQICGAHTHVIGIGRYVGR